MRPPPSDQLGVDVRGFLLVCAGVLFGLAASPGAAQAFATPGCAPAAEATFTHTFAGAAGTASVTAAPALCGPQRQSFALVSYTRSASGRFRYATDTGTIDAGHRTARLAVPVPRCLTEVDLIIGTAVRTELVSGGYGTAILGSPTGSGSRSSGPTAAYTGGAADCAPTPSVTYDNACDGGFRATLANGPDANVAAVFVVHGRTLRVAPGGSVRVTGPRRGTLSIRDNTFTTHIGTWTTPSTACDAAAPSPSTGPATPGRTRLADPASAASHRTTEPPLSTAPAAQTEPFSPYVPAAKAAAFRHPIATPSTDSNVGSTLAVAAGVLMIATGATVLVRVLRAMRRI